ncbi:MAG: uroporphyrinogen-III C-methyltransferase [Planctomycetota bacterium]
MTYGTVYLIGAGPGAADLITVRGRRLLQSADAVLVDQLLPRGLLSEIEIPTAAKQVEWLADKRPRWSQTRINRWLTIQARRGRTVARLKGGDPFVFGHAEEETGHLSKLGIPWQAVPGPSSFTAALTAAGFPLTRRHQGRSFSVVTAMVAGGAVADHFPKSDSLIIMMGVRVLTHVVARLLADGWPPDTPTAVVERGTLAWERRILSPLARLAVAGEEAGIAAPACLLIGNVATPLLAARQRSTILFTGLDPANFRTLGDLIHWPALELAPHPKAKEMLPGVLLSLENRQFDWVLFSGKVGVTSFFEQINHRGLDSRLLAGASIATIERGTANRLREHGIRADVVAENGNAEEAFEALGGLSGRSILMVEGTHSPRHLREGLGHRGATVTTLPLNRVVPNRRLGPALPEHDVIYFVSPAGVRAYYSAYRAAAFKRRVWCLGEETRRELMDLGLKASVWVPGESASSDVVVSA